MFQANDVYPTIDINYLFSKISEYDIFKKYTENFKELNTPFLSSFYEDKQADCIITTNQNGGLYYIDYGETEHRFTCIYYVMFKYTITFKEALYVIFNDFKLDGIKDYIKPNLLIGRDHINTVKIKQKSIITIQARDWDFIDREYWFKYGLDFGKLNDEEIIPVKYVYINKNEKTSIITSTKINPIYAYKEYDYETGLFIGYKIYSPLAQIKRFKWISCASISRSMPGWLKLPKTGDLLILTKSRKDVLCFNLLGYLAVSRQSEGDIFPEDIINELKQRFKRIIIMYDNDQTGLKSAKLMSDKYALKSIIIPLEYNSKDVSDLIAKIGVDEAKIVVNKLINN